MHKTFVRFDNLKSGKQPGFFFPGESFYNTTLAPTILYEQKQESMVKTIRKNKKSISPSRESDIEVVLKEDYST